MLFPHLGDVPRRSAKDMSFVSLHTDAVETADELSSTPLLPVTTVCPLAVLLERLKLPAGSVAALPQIRRTHLTAQTLTRACRAALRCAALLLLLPQTASVSEYLPRAPLSR
jgi:hypothetical protein